MKNAEQFSLPEGYEIERNGVTTFVRRADLTLTERRQIAEKLRDEARRHSVHADELAQYIATHFGDK
jgi:hypothetical protein